MMCKVGCTNAAMRPWERGGMGGGGSGGVKAGMQRLLTSLKVNVGCCLYDSIAVLLPLSAHYGLHEYKVLYQSHM